MLRTLIRPAPFMRMFADIQPAKQADLQSKQEIKEAMKHKIHEIVKSRDIVLFMKGTAKEPLCGFSQYVLNTIAFYSIYVIRYWKISNCRYYSQ